MTIHSALLFAASFLQFFEGRNVAANCIIEPPPDGEVWGETAKPELAAHEKCPACDGKGELKLIEPELGQYNGRIGGRTRKTVKCPLCKGSRRVEAYPDPDRLAAEVASERERFAAAHLAKGDIPVGDAFIPREKYEELSDKKNKAGREKLKLIKETYGEGCAKCGWTGLTACRKCDGKGFVKCTNPDCKDGWAVTKTVSSCSKSSSGRSSSSWRSSCSRRTTRKEERISVNVCPICEGAAIIRCEECGGMRAEPCKRCKGAGFTKKAR